MRRPCVPVSLLFCILTGLFVGGCMVGPKYERPETPADVNDAYSYAGDHRLDINDSDVTDPWWQRFADQTTERLVRQMLDNNYDIKASAARVLQAQAALKGARGGRMPDVSFGISRDRSKRSFNFGGRFSVMSETWTQGVNVGYALDLFGKLKRTERAAWAQMFAASANEQALVHAMIATVIIARIDIATTQRQLAIARENTASRADTLEIVERRYKEGLVGPVDVRLARENLEAARASEPALELALITAQHALDVILGSRPGQSDQLPQTLPDLPDLEPIQVGLSGALLDRRPDVVAAELALRAANEEIGVSIAQLYPDLTMTATFGGSADRWRDIWEHSAETYSLLLNLAGPIFNGGRLKAQVDAAKARFEELAAVYGATVLTAIREVEDALVTEQMLQKQMQHTKLRFEEAAAAENLSKDRYQRGVESILSVLESERRRRIAQERLIILKGRIWTTRVNLHLALGGDWNHQLESQETTVKENDEK
ncbi:MAG: efflux transporter outer membrane subunit [Sedimentisphaerales bacterium]|nr:efflux transporter outer membrane subunit [Sedimentisphaerales bacterium]